MLKSFWLSVLSLVLLPPVSAGQERPNPTTPFTGASLTCESTPQVKETLILKHTVCDARCFSLAQKKAELSELLRQSLYDDAEGIRNVAREKRVKKLLNELRRE